MLQELFNRVLEAQTSYQVAEYQITNYGKSHRFGDDLPQGVKDAHLQAWTDYTSALAETISELTKTLLEVKNNG